MIKQYITTYWKRLLICPICVLIYVSVCFLDDSLNEAIQYASLLVITFYCIFVCVDFINFKTKYQTLKKLEQATETVNVTLPYTRNIIEQQYQTLLKILQQQFVEFQNNEEIYQQERNDYFNMWAHQIKTPIAAMHLLIDDSDASDVKQQLFDIEEYVTNAMHYLRTEQINQDLVIKTYDIDDIIRPLIHHYAPLFIRKRIALNYTQSHYQIITDEKWLSFVIGQIISNALKYTLVGSISIYVQNKTLIIEDTGIGIPKNDLPRIFEKNYTGENGRINGQSSGMGLYLCKKVLDQLAHQIRVESTQGVGTKVIIQLEK